MLPLSRRPIMVALLATGFLLAGCDMPPAKATSDQTMNHQQEQASADAAATVGFPATPNYTEKRLVKMLMELRDRPHLSTFTYVTAMDGHLVKRCDSIGFGISAATQFSSPQKVEKVSSGNGWNPVAVPQADPNGLFSPPSTEGTWVMCVNPKTHDPSPVYIEDRVTVSPFELT